jgi:hypothetical protein
MQGFKNKTTAATDGVNIELFKCLPEGADTLHRSR